VSRVKANLKYLRRKDVLLRYCYEGLRDQFSSEAELGMWYEQIETDEKKNLFLKVAAYYAALVKSGDWHVTLQGSDPVVDYFTNSYKFIAIFSLIESLSELKYVDFYQYLGRKDAGARFPIKRRDLDGLYRRYKKDYGAIQRCIEFFEGLSPKRKKSLVSKLKVDGAEPSIENFAKYLYQLRSKFVHEAELVHPVSAGTWMGFEGKKVTVCSLSLTDTMQFFEEGLLSWFQPKET
jgi:hypothetical protein